ncbi:MAG: hypothetical protein HXX80_05865 [Nitrososphaerales archaeon]|nr:hypothetical protein [Nitrososphaerales archaeon]
MSAAHTAEHVFIGSLKKLIPDIEVRKVETMGEEGSTFVICKYLDWQTILEAEKMTNRVIDNALAIREHFFDSLEGARRAFPTLRAYDERISGRIRVIEIDGYDYTACSAEHVDNTMNCSFFMVTRIAKAGKNLFEIGFCVGEKAKIRALEIAKICMEVSDIVGATLGTLKSTVQNIRDDYLNLRRKLAFLSEREAEGVPFKEKYGIKVYSKVFEGLDNKKLMERAGELTRNKKSVAILANKEGKAFLILCRSSDLSLDCNSLLKEAFVKFDGKGGGKPEFASGVIDLNRVEDALDFIEGKI